MAREKDNIFKKSSRRLIRLVSFLVVYLVIAVFLIINVSLTVREFSTFINTTGKIRGGIQHNIALALTDNSFPNVDIRQLFSELATFTEKHKLFFSEEDLDKIRILEGEWEEVYSLLIQLQDSGGKQIEKEIEKQIGEKSIELWGLTDSMVYDLEKKSQKYLRLLYIATFLLLLGIIVLILLIVIIRLTIEKKIEIQAARDQLTGLLNRNYLNDFLKMRIREIKNSHESVSVLLCDIDHFKLVNDRYGHDEGDRVLRNVSLRINETIRNSDALFRYGGEEFLIVTSFNSTATLINYSERIRKKIEESMRLEYSVTISIGISVLKDQGIKELIKEADKALYQAKENGRNRVELYSS